MRQRTKAERFFQDVRTRFKREFGREMRDEELRYLFLTEGAVSLNEAADAKRTPLSLTKWERAKEDAP